MPSVPVFGAKRRLPEFLLQVQRGDVITITRHGVPMARLFATKAPEAGSRASDLQQQVDLAFQALPPCHLVSRREARHPAE